MLRLFAIATINSLALVGCIRVDPAQSDACCDPAAQPGVGDVPICIEGATCCADGTWKCNQGDGSFSCTAECPAGSCTPSREDTCAAGEFCRLATGECHDSDPVGRCARRPDACILLYDPVCGCDGTTHSNECTAWSAGVNVGAISPCE